MTDEMRESAHPVSIQKFLLEKYGAQAINEEIERQCAKQCAYWRKIEKSCENHLIPVTSYMRACPYLTPRMESSNG